MSSASTGGTEGSSPASSPASAVSLAMAAPKYGTLVPNRIFVGGISASTSEAELAQLFSTYGNVKGTKIISDRAGVSKGYGFVTFETEEEAKRLQQESECIVLRERKLNIAPAIKKQLFNRSFDGSSGSPPAVPTSTYYYTNGMGLAYQNGMTFYNTGGPAPATPVAPQADPTTLYQATSVFGPQATAGHQTFAPVMYPCPAPSLYVPQPYPYSPMPYEPYYAGAAAAGAPQYLYATNSSQNTSNGGGGSSGGGTNGTGATSPPVGPPPAIASLAAPPQTHHFYAPGAPPPHHHPPVPAGPPQPQVDHLYYSFAAGPPPPPPPHTQIGLADQQLLLYTTDGTCQPQQSNDSQGQPQETCLNDNDADGSVAQMHCRTIVYHPATVYIPHSHAPPFHQSSGGPSLLPTPTPASQPHHTSLQSNINPKLQTIMSQRGDYSKAVVASAQGSFVKSQNLSISLISSGVHHQGSGYGKSHGVSTQSHKYASSQSDFAQKFTANVVSTARFPAHHQYTKRSSGTNAGSTMYFPGQRSGYGSHKSMGFATGAVLNGFNYPTSCSGPQKTGGYITGQNYDTLRGGSYNYIQKNNTGGQYKTRRSFDNSNSSGQQTSENFHTTNQTVSQITHNNNNTADTATTVISEKSSSPPPAPYSPMTRPLPTLSPPVPQVQFYAPTQNRYQPAMPPPSTTSGQQQQQQQQQPAQRRYTAAPPVRRPSEKYPGTPSQGSMLRQHKYKTNGLMQAGGKSTDDSLGGAGDAPPGVGRMPLTPPGTPRNNHPAHSTTDQNQINDTCHQIQALSL
uniref:Boule-2 n=1 Tax=Athalia rosae TaxID=37344 RepID=K7ZJS1_ATHRO|nr:boule-2 [Athalia rosae]BAM66421.1 boule-2 [Athalia rosae]